MNFGFGQILLILLAGFLLFGNVPEKMRDIARGIRLAKKEMKKKDGDGKKEDRGKSP